MPDTELLSAPRSVPAAGVSYEQVTPWYAQRRSFRLIVLLLVLNIIAVTSITWGPITTRLVQERLAERKAIEAQAQAAAVQAQADAAAAAVHQAAVAARAARVLKCRTYSLPPGTVVYTENFVEAARLLPNGKAGYVAVRQQGQDSPIRLPHPPVLLGASVELRHLITALHDNVKVPLPSPSREADGTLFLHERKTPSGQSRILWVRVNARRSPSGLNHDQDGSVYVYAVIHRSLVIEVADASDETQPGKTIWRYNLEIQQQPDQRLKVLAEPGSRSTSYRNAIAREGEALRLMTGTLDPANPSRMTIPYQLDEIDGQIEVLLMDDNRLQVRVDRGDKSVTVFDRTTGQEIWDPRAKKIATRPSP